MKDSDNLGMRNHSRSGKVFPMIEVLALMATMVRRFLVVLPLALTVLSACAKSTGTASLPTSQCTKAGEQCVYAEGKIGLCTQNAIDCDGSSSCLVCMSLH
jgi:hypothetical protein